jgi:N-acetylneuraminic acid mutarotase
MRHAASRPALFAMLLLTLSVAGPRVASAQEKWTTLAPLPQPQAESVAAALDGRIYVIGGWGKGGSDEPFTVVQVYDVATNQWSEGTPLPEPVHHAGAAVVGGKIYMIGGYRNSFRQRGPTDAVRIYDPATKAWSRGAPVPTTRGALAVAAIGNLIYAVGGERPRAPGAPVPPGANPNYEPVTDLAVYDTQADRWQTLAPMRHAREHVIGAAIGGRFYAVGGRDRPRYDLAHLEEYDPATKTWTERPPMPTGRSGGAGAVLDGKLYVFGGEGNPASPLGIFGEVEAYDPATNSWRKLAAMATPRHSVPAAVVGNRIYLPGGTPRADNLRPRDVVSEVVTLFDAFELAK